MRINQKTLDKFITLLYEAGWTVENAHSKELLESFDNEIQWILTHEKLARQTILRFFIIDPIGRTSQYIKDILWVENNQNQQLFFKKDNLDEQINFIKNL